MPVDLTNLAFWETTWEQAQATAPRIGYAERFWSQLYQIVFQNAQPGQRFLEVGCGNSQHLPIIAQRFGLEVAGLDYTEIGCEMARRWLDRASVAGQVYQRDLFAANEDLHGQFDYVASFGLIEHFDDPSRPIRAMRNFLKPGGRLITTVPNLDPVSLLVRAQRIIGPRTLAAHQLMKLEDFRRFHEICGLRTSHCDFEGMGVSLVCDEATPRNRLVHAAAFRSVQVLRRAYELLGQPLPRWRFTSLMMLYIGEV